MKIFYSACAALALSALLSLNSTAEAFNGACPTKNPSVTQARNQTHVSVPEPSTLALLGSGLLFGAARLLKREKKD